MHFIPGVEERPGPLAAVGLLRERKMLAMVPLAAGGSAMTCGHPRHMLCNGKPRVNYKEGRLHDSAAHGQVPLTMSGGLLGSFMTADFTAKVCRVRGPKVCLDVCDVLDLSPPVFYQNHYMYCWILKSSRHSYRNLRKMLCNVAFGLRQVVKPALGEDNLGFVMAVSGAARDKFDRHSRNTAAEYDIKSGRKRFSCAAKRQSDNYNPRRGLRRGERGLWPALGHRGRQVSHGGPVILLRATLPHQGRPIP